MLPSAAFLDEIRAHPDDDAPRLVYADWLEEAGNPRGEFVRLQCQLERLPRDDERASDLKVREQDLLEAYRDDWLGPLKDCTSHAVFRRGFVEYVETTADKFVRQAAAMFRAAPIRSAALSFAGDCVEPLAACEELSHLTGLCLRYGVMQAPEMRVLCRSPHLRGLTRLMLPSLELGDQGVAILVGSPIVESLHMLDLSRNQLRNEAAQAIGLSPQLGQLEALLLAGNEIRLMGATALAASRRLPKLRHLDLSHNPLPQAGVDKLRKRYGRSACVV